MLGALRVGLFLLAALATGCLYPELKSGAGGAHSTAGTQAAAGTRAGGSGTAGSAAGAAGTSSDGTAGSAAGAAGNSSGGRGGSAGGGKTGSADAGIQDAPGTQPDAPAGGTGGGGTSAGGQSGTGGSGGSSSGTGLKCPALTNPSNGSVSAPTRNRGETAVYSCDTGYRLTGSKTRTCQADGTWNLTDPTCTIVDCGALTDPANGSVSAAPTTYGSTGTYTCQAGFGLVGTSPRTCQADGTWSDTAPTCGQSYCPTPPSPTHGTVTTTATTVGSTGTYACSAGYTLSGTATTTCQSDRTWSGTLPTCTAVDCGKPLGTAYGFVSAPITTYGSTATYSCAPGYSLDSPATVTCQANGAWSGKVPLCNPVDCGPIATPDNGTVNVTASTYGSTATYKCNTGYASTDPLIRTCQADGTWTGVLPTCAIQMLKVTVSKTGKGTGTVSGSYGSASISCGSTCTVTSATYRYGTEVDLTATPDSGQQFIGWTSTPSSTTCTGRFSDCSVTLTQDTTVQANFSPPPNYVFTTSTTQTAALGGLAGADTICKNLAIAAKLPGTYVAWLSTSTVNAVSRLNGASGWIRPGDFMPVLNNVEDIAKNKFVYPPRMDELGRDVGASQIVMTGTNMNGTLNVDPEATTCSSFTSAASVAGMYLGGGYASANSSMFTEGTWFDCGQLARLYCFGIDRQAQVAVTSAMGRHAFLTKGTWLPNSQGIMSADELCTAEAANAGMTGWYKALLAPSGSTMALQFDLTGAPWTRSDGLMLAPSAGLFLSGTATTFGVPPNMSADGSVYYGLQNMWIGAVSPTTLGTDATTCSNWTSTSGAGLAGLVGDTSTSMFFEGYANSCSYPLPLVCLQV
jgi:hypothetical protein